MPKKIILIVLDSFGIGALPDAADFGDEGADTAAHIARSVKGFKLPGLCGLGLGKIANMDCSSATVTGAFGRMNEVSPAKDTTTGHWELCGHPLDTAFKTYPGGFPERIIKEFENIAGCRTIGNYPMSGTEILKQLGREHLETGYPIVYTSADSVFQVAAHEDIFSLEELYELCRKARKMLTGDDSISRVIARPFRGKPGSFKRNEQGRKDFSVEPENDTLLDKLKQAGKLVAGIGKIGDIFAHRGLTDEIKIKNNIDGIKKTVKALGDFKDREGLIFVNLVEFDSVYGHRRDPEGYAVALMEFDRKLKDIKGALFPEDILMITADHGCDPTFTRHTDHTREYVPILAAGEKVVSGRALGTRKSFSDCGQTVADILGIEKLQFGESFKDELLKKG